MKMFPMTMVRKFLILLLEGHMAYGYGHKSMRKCKSYLITTRFGALECCIVGGISSLFKIQKF